MGSAPPSRFRGVRLLVSIHDVTPALGDECTSLWALCRDVGVVPALLVVPNWHGAAPLAKAPTFVAWLRDCITAGAEIILHGERHDEVGLPRGWRDELAAIGKTAREGEFLTLHRAGAGECIERGVTLLRGLGLPPVGFVPPAWLARQDCWDAARAHGLLVGEKRREVLLLQQQRQVPSPNLCWSGRTPWRAIVSERVVTLQLTRLRPGDVVRVALHPADLRHPATRRSIRDVLQRLVHGGATVERYEALGQ